MRRVFCRHFRWDETMLQEDELGDLLRIMVWILFNGVL